MSGNRKTYVKRNWTISDSNEEEINVLNRGGLSVWWQKINEEKWKHVMNSIYYAINKWLEIEMVNAIVYK